MAVVGRCEVHDDKTGMCDHSNALFWLASLGIHAITCSVLHFALLLQTNELQAGIIATKRVDRSASSNSRFCSLRDDCAS